MNEQDPITLAIDRFTKIMQRGYDHYHDEKHVQEAIKSLRALQSQPATDGLGKVRDALDRLHENSDYNGCLLDYRTVKEFLDSNAAHNPWQPIETAPRDGKTVLIRDYYQTSWEKYDDGRYIQTGPDGYDIVSARFDNPEGWVLHQRNGNVIKLVNPTHWMPLPAAPDLNGEW